MAVVGHAADAAGVGSRLEVRPPGAGGATLEGRLDRDGVLLLGENAGMGGINSYLVNLADGLRQRGIPVTVAVVWPKEDEWLAGRCRELDIPLTVLARHRTSEQLPLAAWRLAHQLPRVRPAVLHTQAHFSGLVGRAAVRLSGRNACLVSTLHDIIVGDARLGMKFVYWLDWATYGCNRATAAVSEHLAGAIRKRGVRVRQLEVVRNGIPLRPDSSASGVRSSETAAGLPVIGFVGRLSSEKNCAALIQAAARLVRQRGRIFRLLILGDGPERAALEGLARTLGVWSVTTFEGSRSNVDAYYEQMDLVAVPSLREGLPLVVLEAMRLRLPVVASRTGGIPEVVSDEETGLLVQPGDVVALADAIARCLDDPALRGRLGEAGRRRVGEVFSLDGMVERTIAMYRRALTAATVR